jgi:hypothetical protein
VTGTDITRRCSCARSVSGRGSSVPTDLVAIIRWPRVFLLLLLCLLAAAPAPSEQWLGAPETVADGITLYRVRDPHLLRPAGPVAVQLLRLDPDRVELRSALGRDEIKGTERVLDIATRNGAIAAVNAGFFEPSGEPAGVLKIGGQLVSDASRQRGAVAILAPGDYTGPIRLLFDRVTVAGAIRFKVEGRNHTVPIAGIDTTQARGGLTLYTSWSRREMDSGQEGTEWVLRGSPFTVRERRSGTSRTPVPKDGAVLSFGGTTPPRPLDRLEVGSVVEIVQEFVTGMGTRPRDWLRAPQIVGGAGLLVFERRMITDWAPERMREGFTTERHPRTIIGVGSDREIWLVTVDGRQPEISLGMSFIELQGLARRLGLRGALNLDGGGSTTMVVKGQIVNHPSDPTGPRAVSDALLVFARERRK